MLYSFTHKKQHHNLNDYFPEGSHLHLMIARQEWHALVSTYLGPVRFELIYSEVQPRILSPTSCKVFAKKDLRRFSN